jgi:hypothetical protein
MPTGVRNKKVIVGAAEAGVDDIGAEPTCRSGRGRCGVAELIDAAIVGVHPSTTQARQTGRWFAI